MKTTEEDGADETRISRKDVEKKLLIGVSDSDFTGVSPPFIFVKFSNKVWYS
jgi:hypothetical protein